MGVSGRNVRYCQKYFYINIRIISQANRRAKSRKLYDNSKHERDQIQHSHLGALAPEGRRIVFRVVV